MKKLFILSLFLLFLCACTKTYTLDDGRYMQDGTEEGNGLVPYLLIQEGKLTVVPDIVISYVPSGAVSVKGDEVIMETEYADKHCVFAFKMTDDNTLQFLSEKSELPDLFGSWDNGIIFRLAEEQE